MGPVKRVACVLTLAVTSLGIVAGSAAADGTLFWYDAVVADGRVLMCDVAGCTPTDFATSLPSTLGGDMAIDPVEGMVYWGINAASSSKVQRKSLSGGAVEDIFDLPANMTGIAIDPVARHVYVATPGTATRIWRYSIDTPGNPTSFVHYFDSGCTCSPQGLALDLTNGFLYWSDANNGKIARKPLDSSTAIQDVVTGISQPNALALDLANDRVYFGQTVPNRISYALLSSPASITDIVNPAPAGLFAGSIELDPKAGPLGELYVTLASDGEVRHCDLDAGCPSLVLLASGVLQPRGLAFLATIPVPALGAGGAVTLGVLLAAAGIAASRRPPRWRRTERPAITPTCAFCRAGSGAERLTDAAVTTPRPWTPPVLDEA